MELRRAATVLRRWALLIVVGTVLAGVTAFAVSTTIQKVYESGSTLIVGQSLTAVNPDSNQLLVSQRLSQTYAELAVTRPLLERVIAKLGLSTSAADLEKRVSADPHRDTSLLTVTAKDATPDRAAAIANQVAEELIALSPTVAAQRILDDSTWRRA